MSATANTALGFAIHPLTPERWDDLVALFGPHGAAEGCWCMWFRQPGRLHKQRIGSGNRRALQGLVDAGSEPGLLAYRGGVPIGWCSVAPRGEFIRLQRSPTLKPLDDQPVWSVVCLFIARGHRRQGIGTALLRAAIDYAVAHGARIVEGYPLDAGGRRVHSGAAFPGVVPMFERAGFAEVARRYPTRPIMRYTVPGAP
jgi:GNAT superfamily N-acetyltransferase